MVYIVHMCTLCSYESVGTVVTLERGIIETTWCVCDNIGREREREGGGRERGREGGTEGERERGREGGRGGREGGRERGREGRERGREGEREGGREGGRERAHGVCDNIERDVSDLHPSSRH